MCKEVVHIDKNVGSLEGKGVSKELKSRKINSLFIALSVEKEKYQKLEEDLRQVETANNIDLKTTQRTLSSSRGERLGRKAEERVLL